MGLYKFEFVLGAAEDGSVKGFVLSIAIFQRRNPRPTHVPSLALPLGYT